MVIASHLVVPDDITVSWSDIAGLDAVIEELRESVVLPIRHRNLFANSQLWQAPKGVLLHGPPGCGKTLIAKATAKEAGMRFINLDVAMLTDKWYGESQKLASAVFSLAAKLQPCIVFIDEIDSFLRSRNTHDHEATAMMKTQFMMLWDGLSTSQGSTVIVMGRNMCKNSIFNWFFYKKYFIVHRSNKSSSRFGQSHLTQNASTIPRWPTERRTTSKNSYTCT